MGNSKRAKQQRRAQRAIAGSTTFWHGGVAGRAVGDLLLSPNLTHDPKSVSTLGIREARADRVYFTTDRELARVYASYVQRSRPSALYRVTPIGDLESDPDYPTAGYQSVKARVLEVAELNVVLTRLECAQRCQPYETHVGGGLIHDVDGRVLLSKGMGEAGFTQADLDVEIPRWTALEDAAELLSDLSLRRRAKALSAQLWAARVASPTNVVSEL